MSKKCKYFVAVLFGYLMISTAAFAQGALIVPTNEVDFAGMIPALMTILVGIVVACLGAVVSLKAIGWGWAIIKKLFNGAKT